ncbi:glycosyltransferase family 4 protein [Candidatus Woesearchaeota archaeon]|nr:glycosyltransferase family 4 protein [Candidatus Woesearchaeota archaeon]
MKNVLVLTSTFPRWKNDSTPSFVFTLSNFSARKYKMTILAPHAYKSAKNEKLDNLHVKRFKYFFPEKYQKIAYGAGIIPNVKKSFLAKMQIPGFLASQIGNANNIIKKEKINLVHAHWIIPQGLIGAILKKKYRIPLIVTIHGSDLFPLKNKLFKKLQKFVVNNADFITVNSKTAEKELISRFPHVKNKVKIIPMGIDTNLFKPKNVKNKYQKYKNNKILLFAGRINEQKGIEYLIKAMQEVVSKIKNAKLLIIGNGEHRKNLEKLAAGLNLTNSVEFLGFKSHKELADYYNLADVFVLPSVTSKIGTEAFGLVLVEAMASGTCVIGSSSGGIKDIINNGKNGLIFQEKNSKELTDKIIKMLTNEKLRNRLSRNGLKFARQNYDWEIISKKFLDIYNKLLK